MHKIGGAHIHCVNYIMQSLNVKEWILLEFQFTLVKAPEAFRKGKNVCSTPFKIKKNKINVHKIEGANLQCVNNHYAKFEYKGMNTVGVTDYTN